MVQQRFISVFHINVCCTCVNTRTQFVVVSHVAILSCLRVCCARFFLPHQLVSLSFRPFNVVHSLTFHHLDGLNKSAGFVLRRLIKNHYKTLAGNPITVNLLVHFITNSAYQFYSFIVFH